MISMLLGSSWPIFCTTLADMGRPEIPGGAYHGIDFSLCGTGSGPWQKERRRWCRIRKPQAEHHDQQGVKAYEGIRLMLKEMVIPQKQGNQVGKGGLAVSERFPRTLHSRSRFRRTSGNRPKIRRRGNQSHQEGKNYRERILVVLCNLVWLVWRGMRIRLFVVTRRMAKGYTMGTSV